MTMRLYSLVSVLILCLASFNTRSQISTDSTKFSGFKSSKLPLRQNVIKSNIIPVFVGQIPLCGELRFTYEKMIEHNQSLSIGASYNFPNLFFFVLPAIFNAKNSNLKYVSLRGGRLIFAYRYYLLKEKQAPEGLFIGPYFSYNFVKIKERTGNGSYLIYNYANASLVAGYQFHLSKGVFMEAFGGLGYRKNFVVSYDAHHNSITQADLVYIRNNPFKNVKLVLQVNIGYGF